MKSCGSGILTKCGGESRGSRPCPLIDWEKARCTQEKQNSQDRARVLGLAEPLIGASSKRSGWSIVVRESFLVENGRS